MTDSPISKFLLMLQEFQKIDSEFPLQYKICLCVISQNEGLSLTELSDITGMPLSTVSRIISALSQNRTNRRHTYGLVKITVVPTERRKKQLFLTARGKMVIESIARIIEEKDSKRLSA